MSQMWLKARISIIPTTYSIIYEIVKYIQKDKMIVFVFYILAPNSWHQCI